MGLRLAGVQRQSRRTLVVVKSPTGPIEVDPEVVTILRHLWDGNGLCTATAREDDLGSVSIHMDFADYHTLTRRARASADLQYFLNRCQCELSTFFPEDFDGLEIPESVVPPTEPQDWVVIRFPNRHKELFERLLAALEVPLFQWPVKRARVTYYSESAFVAERK